MWSWRRLVGIVLILTPLIAIVCGALLGILLGSMGMDIHWTSKAASEVTISSAVLVLCACVAGGICLCKSSRQSGTLR